MKYADIHAHTWELKDEKEILKQCEKKKIAVVNNGTNDKTNETVLKSNTLRAVGWWPGEKSDFKIIEKQAQNEGVKAIGEIGLDLHHDIPFEKQLKQFKRMLELAKELDKPVIVHSRKAEKQVLDTLEKYDLTIIMHAFSGNKKLAYEGVIRGYYFSIPTIVLRSSNFQTLAKTTPKSQLLTESDTPYLGITFPNTPLTMPLVVEKIEQLRGERIKRVVVSNFNKLIK